MRDGNTRILHKNAAARGFEAFRAGYRADIVLMSGPATGSTFELDQARTTLGRGPGVGVAFDNPMMSRQHAAIDYTDDGFVIRDLGSTNGLLVNGKRVEQATLQAGDRFEIGGQTFQLLIEEREDEPDTYELPAAE
jgi:pSer/pThr/pTyr-binding forkhead associated (FHA) protein